MEKTLIDIPNGPSGGMVYNPDPYATHDSPFIISDLVSYMHDNNLKNEDLTQDILEKFRIKGRELNEYTKLHFYSNNGDNSETITDIDMSSFKILSHLAKCSKAGISSSVDVAKSVVNDDSIFEEALVSLIDKGFVKISEDSKIFSTQKGISYLKDNQIMKEVKAALGTTFETRCNEIVQMQISKESGTV
jgi:predicted transcriptional regulator